MDAEISDQHNSEWAAISEVARLLGGRHSRDGAQTGRTASPTGAELGKGALSHYRCAPVCLTKHCIS